MHIKYAIATLGALLLTGPVFAQNAPSTTYTNGDQYITLPSPERYSSKGKVEVVEVFSYGCIHCAHFAPYMEKLIEELPKGVAVHYVPADFSPVWEPYARAFYAAQDLGAVKSTHLAVFKAKFEQNYPMNSLDDFANFYASHGYDRKAFLKDAKSASTDRKLAANRRLIKHWHVMGTPTVIVDGKYQVKTANSYEQMVATTLWLVKRALKAKAGKH